MKKTAFIIFSLFAITGCSSLNDVREKTPVGTFSTKKNLDKVSECVLFGWQNQKYMIGGSIPTFIQPLLNGKTVYTEDNTYVADFISSDNKLTEIKFYSQAPYLRDRMRDVIKSCI
ncbi:hypothetical protein HZI31_07515 [Serratia fonticola]|uniref:hypothetical protein n=1 Tax=Serratia fonticola TaxID=47917 RepID=UPI0015C5C041|nr:hypothetical protein [Serratia fonticola]NYA43150.1 hypothetical protein [Serratia fonticola]